MPQDQETKHRYEHEAAEHKLEREHAAEERVENAIILDGNDQIHADHLTGKDSGAPSVDQRDLIDGDQIKHIYTLLPNWHKDELRRLKIVRPGTQLAVDHAYIDLHNLLAGAQHATGSEIVHDTNQLFVSKKDTDFEVWDRLLSGDI